VSPKRKSSQDAPGGARTRSESVDMLTAYREAMEALRIELPDYLLRATEEMGAASPGSFAEPIPDTMEARAVVEASREGRLQPGTIEWLRFQSFMNRAMGPSDPEHAEKLAEKLATLFFLYAWNAYANPEDPLSPMFETEARAAVLLAIDFFLDWRKKAERLSTPEGGISQVAVQLAYMEAAVAMETNLARAPIFGGKPRGPLQLSLERVGSLYGRPFNVLEPKGPLTVQDAQLLAHLIKRYAEEGFPPDRRVRMSLSEAARASGYSTAGGRQRELVRRAFMRMRATTYQNVVRLPDGTVKSLTWGLIDWAATYEPSEDTGRALVTLSEPLVNLIQVGSLVYLQEDLFAELVRRDEYGARLWVFLESESLSSPRDYLLFSAPEGGIEQERDTPAIADLLRIDWASRKKIAARMRKASQIIGEADPRYSLSVETAKGKGMWKLKVRKGRGSVKGLGPERTSRDLTGYSEGPYRVPPGTLPGTSRDRGILLSPVKNDVLEVVPSVLPSVLPSDLPSEGFDFLKKQLGEPFGVSVEELRSSDSDWYKTLSRASSRFREMLPTYFPGADPEEEEELLKRLLRSMVVGLRDKSPEDPLRYLSTSIKQARTPEGLLIEAYALESVKAWYGANSKAKAEAFQESLKAWSRERDEGGSR
jgi:hypothetical protein